MRRITAFVVAASLTVFGLAACSSVPDSGPVREGLRSLDQGERGVLINPSGPVAGADQETIVRGFIRAGSSNENDYAIAREFLAPSYADNWDPSLGVLVNDGTMQYEGTDEGIAVISLHVTANVDENGTLTPAEPGRTTDVQFELARIDGEWRITSAPAGLILDRNTFLTVWTTRPLFFLSPNQRLVSEWRWFLNRPTLPTQVVRGLLQGPSEAMAPALYTAFPTGTQLTSNAVPVNDDTAIIDLSPEIFDANDEQMAQIKRQIAASLLAVGGITGFQLTVHGTPIDNEVTPVAEDTSGSERQGVYVISEGSLLEVTSDGMKPVGRIGVSVDDLEPRSLTVGSDGESAAVLGSNGTTYVTENASILIDERPGQLTPSLDPFGFVWTYSGTEPEHILATPSSREQRDFGMPWLGAGKVVAARVSMSGSRLALLVDDDETSRVVIAGIIRDENGTPTGLTTGVPQLWEEGAPIDMDWIGGSRFAVLSQTGLLGGSAKVTIGEVGGRFPQEAGAVAGGTGITGGNNRQQLRIVDDQGRLFAPQGGAGWQQLLSGVDVLAKIG